MDEPVYVEAGDEFGDLNQKKRPKWQSPTGKWQMRILRAAHRKYYRDRDEQRVVNQIARQAITKEVSIEGWPMEWIEFCCTWCEQMWYKNKPIKLWGLLNFIMDDDKKVDWLASLPKPDMKPKPKGEWSMYD